MKQHKTTKTMKDIYGENVYKEMAAKGVEAYKKRQALGIAKPRGFAANPDLARRAGKIGGKARKGRTYSKDTPMS